MAIHPQNELVIIQAVEAGELEIDSEGRIWRVKKRTFNRWTGKVRTTPCHRVRAENETPDGYLQIRVMIDGRRYHTGAHRVVYLTGKEDRGGLSDGTEGRLGDLHREDLATYNWLRDWLAGKPPPNIWLGTTCEDQAAYDRRWPILREVPARVRFISYEPAIGPLRILGEDQYSKMPDWLICGGESGRGYREMPLQWANDIGWICKANNVPFFMKQVSGFKPKESDIPPGLLVREFPVAT